MKNISKLLLLALMTTLLIGCTQKKDIINQTNEPIINNTNDTEYVEKLCRIYYFDKENLAVKYTDKNLKFEPNDLDKILINELQNNSNENLMSIPEDVEIIETVLHEDKSLLKIKFNKDFIKYMPLGTATESGLIESIVKTYGYNYNTDYVAIYFNDKLYTGLKGELDNDGFKVDTEKEDANTSKSEEMSIRLYLYDGNKDELSYKDKSVIVNDKAIVTAMTNELINTSEKDFFDFENDLKVKTAKIDKTKDLEL